MERDIYTLPRVEIPRHIPATAEEIERRRALAAEIDKLAEEIGMLDYDTAELIREGREDDEQQNG
jgi:hypothetical protein